MLEHYNKPMRAELSDWLSGAPAQVVRSLRTNSAEAPDKQFQNLALILKLAPSCFGVTQFLTTNLLKKVQNTKFLALF